MSETTRKIVRTDESKVSVTEYAELRRYLCMLIAEVKKTAHFVPNVPRASLLQVATEAEKFLT